MPCNHSICVRISQGAALAALCGLLLVGCSPAKYRQAADDEVYKILGDRSEAILGLRQDHSIDTPSSLLEPDDVNGSGILSDRNQTGQDNLLTLKDTLNLATKANRSY